jgi:hypothetical protein
MSTTSTIPSSSSVLSRTHHGATLERTVRALVVSPRLEVRKPLVQVLESLSADVVTCSTRAQADEVLSHQSFEVVFCDEHLPDGSFADLITPGITNARFPESSSRPASGSGSSTLKR